MCYDYHKELIDYFEFQQAWCEWLKSEPSLRHPIKWYFNEPKYRMENSNAKHNT